MMLDEREWRCPTCIDLCFKPAVNSGCGHVFCFWCIHKAMSPYAASACPVCRAKTGHLPAICAKLHMFLSCQFPEAYAERRQETEADEREVGAASPDPELSATLPPPTAPGQWSVQHFRCDNPSCSQLLCQPLVLNCGHAVCQQTCLDVTNTSRGGTAAPSTSSSPATAPAAAAAAAGRAAAGGGPAGAAAGAGAAAPSGSPAICALGSALMGNTAAGGVAYECPACGMAGRQPPKVCRQLGDLIEELFPEESRQRQAECQQAQQAQQQAEGEAAAAAAGAAAMAATGLAAGGATAEYGVGEEGGSEPVTPRASAAASEGVGGQGEQGQEATAPDHPQWQYEQQGQQQGQEGDEEAEGGAEARTLSPSLTAALRRRAAAGGPEEAIAQRMNASMQRMATSEGYTWHGVGCDCCGLYPIKGKRYQCQDCPDAMGFDLCGACFDRGLSDVVGRFNQRHTPEHRMHQVRPRITAMHMLQAANPELPMEQLMYLLELSMGGDEEDEAEQALQQRVEEAERRREEAEQRQVAAEQRREAAEQRIEQLTGQVEQRVRQAEQREQQAQQAQQQAQQGPQPQQPQQQQGEAEGGDDGTADRWDASGEGQAAGGAGADEGGGSEMLPVLRRGPRPVFDASAEEPSPSAYAPRQQQQQQEEEEQQQQQQQQGAAGGEASGLIEDDEADVEMLDGQEQEEEAGVTAVHVPLLGGPGGPPPSA